jgi:hypothetical protein
LIKKQGAVFVPQRCEVKGCDKTGDEVRKCGSCKLVFYCGKEHQTQDWSHHKLDCKHLKSSELRRRYFSTAEELEKFPIGCFPLSAPEPEATLKCFICGAGQDEVKLGFTECCNASVCDNEEEYVMFSYSRDLCKRSHSRYTSCGFHHTEGHEGDWRVCSKCPNSGEGGNSRSWYATNGFNVTPVLEADIPQGSHITKPCDGCKRRITPGHDGETCHPDGRNTCTSCS